MTSKANMSTANNSTRNFSEPPPYPGTTVPRTTTPYSHISHSTINKFSGMRNDSNKPSALLIDQRKPYVPLGEIRRNVPGQVGSSNGRPAPIQQQIGVPQVHNNQMMVASNNRDLQSGPPNYQAATNTNSNGPSFNQQVSQASLRPVPLKEDGGEGEQQMSEEELMMLSVPVLARRLMDAQNKISAQTSEIKGIIQLIIYRNIWIEQVLITIS